MKKDIIKFINFGDTYEFTAGTKEGIAIRAVDVIKILDENNEDSKKELLESVRESFKEIFIDKESFGNDIRKSSSMIIWANIILEDRNPIINVYNSLKEDGIGEKFAEDNKSIIVLSLTETGYSTIKVDSQSVDKEYIEKYHGINNKMDLYGARVHCTLDVAVIPLPELYDAIEEEIKAE